MEDLDRLLGKTIKYVNRDDANIRIGFIGGTSIEIFTECESDDSTAHSWLIVDPMWED